MVFDADPTDTVVDVFRNTTVAAFRERHLSVLVVKADDRPYTTTGPHNRAYQDPGRTRALTQPLGRDGRPSVVLVENDVMIERWVPPIAASVVIERVDSLPAREREVAAKLARMRQRPPRSDRSVLSEPPAGCPTKVNGCLRKYARARMSEKDIEHLYEAGIPECLTKEPLELSRRAQCLPVIMGADARNGNDVELRYFCSDVCPDQGRVNLVYAGLTEEECCNLSAYPMRDPAWGSYEGCIPAGLFRPLQIGYAEDGRKVLMTRDPCTGVSSYVRELRPGEFGSRR